VRARDVVRILPEVIQRTHTRGAPLAALAETMASLLDPADQRLKRLADYFDPYRAPDPMVPYLASWVDLGWLPVREEATGDGLSIERLRVLVAEAPRLAASRGTAAGLRRFLEIALNESVVEVRDGDPARPFHLVIELPKSARAQRRLADLIVRHEKPVHLTHEVLIDEDSPSTEGGMS